MSPAAAILQYLKSHGTISLKAAVDLIRPNVCYPYHATTGLLNSLKEKGSLWEFSPGNYRAKS